MTTQPTTKCSHRRYWLIADGFWAWCWTCGAIRAMRRVEGTANGFTWAEKRWTKPVGAGGVNPALRGKI